MAKQTTNSESPKPAPEVIAYTPPPRHVLGAARRMSEKWGLDPGLLLAWAMVETGCGKTCEGSNHFNLKYGKPPDYRSFTPDGRNIFSVYVDGYDLAASIAKKSGDPLEHVVKATGKSKATITKLIETINTEAENG